MAAASRPSSSLGPLLVAGGHEVPLDDLSGLLPSEYTAGEQIVPLLVSSNREEAEQAILAVDGVVLDVSGTGEHRV